MGNSGNSDGGCIGSGSGGPVEPVIVVEVHQNGHRLSQDNAQPHDHIAYLPPGKRQRSQNA